MRKKIFSVYDILFIIAALSLFVCAVMLPPVRSIADQGDFERVMRPCGLDFLPEHSFYDYAQRFYELKFTRADFYLLLPRLLFIVPSTSFIYPALLARLLCMPSGMFDTRVLAIIMCLCFGAVCFFILRRVQIKNPVLRLLFTAIFLFIFWNGVNLTFFNSLYGQSVMLVSFSALVLSGIYLFDNPENAKKRHIIFFALCSCLLISSKLQCAVFTPFLAALLIYAAVKSRRVRLGIVCAALVLWNGVGGYVINGSQLGTDTQYNSVFYGILKDSPDAADDLTALGIDPDMAADADKHAYLDASEYKYPPRTEITYEKFHSKINNAKLIKFYITHPRRFIRAMEITAENAFTNKIALGTFEKKYGLSAGESSYRLEMWEALRSGLPKNLAFIVTAFCALLLFGAFLFRRKSKYALPFLTAIIMGVIQFPMPYMGNGAADISKQLFMFNLIFDFGITVVLYALLKLADKKISKRS